MAGSIDGPRILGIGREHGVVGARRRGDPRLLQRVECGLGSRRRGPRLPMASSSSSCAALRPATSASRSSFARSARPSTLVRPRHSASSLTVTPSATSVGAEVHALRRAVRVAVAEPLRCDAELEVHEDVAELGQHVFALGELDHLTAAGLGSVVEGGERGERARGTGDAVHVLRRRRLHQRRTPVPEEGGEAAETRRTVRRSRCSGPSRPRGPPAGAADTIMRGFAVSSSFS